MGPLFPSSATIKNTFAPKHPLSHADQWQESRMPEPSRFPAVAFSVAEETKGKASALGQEAQREIQKASSAAQAKTGEIELYSPKYYAACTFGGLVACVGISKTT